MIDTTLKNWTQHYDSDFLPQREEPEWMSKMRQQAWEIYLDLPEAAPVQRNLRKIPVLKREELNMVQSSEQTIDILRKRVQSWGDSAGIYLEQGGSAISSELQDGLSEQGVILCSLADALAHYPELVQKHFGQIYPAIAGKEIALNMAYWHGGYFLFVPKNIKVELPLYVLQSITGNSEVLFSRSVIVVESGSQVSLIHDTYSAHEAEPSLVSDILEIYLYSNAELNVLGLQQWDKSIHAHTYAQAKLDRDARYTVLNIGTGAAYHYAQSGTSLDASGADAQLLGLYLGESGQHFRQNSLQHHFAPHTRSDLQYHTVLKDQAYSFYNGTIYVAKEAQQTDSNQVNKAMLLSQDARADAIPNLEIYADDVQSGHGAAVSNLDSEQLFYLMSRGFDQKTAESVIVEGFMESVLLRFPNQSLNSTIQSHLSMHLLSNAEAEK